MGGISKTDRLTSSPQLKTHLGPNIARKIYHHPSINAIPSTSVEEASTRMVFRETENSLKRLSKTESKKGI